MAREEAMDTELQSLLQLPGAQKDGGQSDGDDFCPLTQERLHQEEGASRGMRHQGECPRAGDGVKAGQLGRLPGTCHQPALQYHCCHVQQCQF